LWIECAAYSSVLDTPHAHSVYQLSDKYELTRYASQTTRTRLAATSAALVTAADVVTCTARTLYRELHQQRSDVLYLPHAVDLDLFQPRLGPPPPELGRLPKPIIGYFGTLSASNNQEMILAAARAHPEWSIVLIGRITGGDWSRLQAQPNVHFLGFKPLSAIPWYGTQFDVAFMNWHIDEWMHYAHPLKTREYLALGLPVVSVPIPEIVESYREWVYLARSPEDFVSQVERALRENTLSLAAARRSWVARYTWDNYVDCILQALAERRATHGLRY
jgi:glycosyltransferase involved in cell wall biosynthesis